jgi:hypothetical protein
VPRHEAAEGAHEERCRDERREFPDYRNFQHGIERDDAALDPVEHHDVAQIPFKEEHAGDRGDVRDDERDCRLRRERQRFSCR